MLENAFYSTEAAHNLQEVIFIPRREKLKEWNTAWKKENPRKLA